MLAEDAKARLGTWMLSGRGKQRFTKPADVDALRVALAEAQITERPALGLANEPFANAVTVEDELKRISPDGNLTIEHSEQISQLAGDEQEGVFVRNAAAGDKLGLGFWGNWAHTSTLGDEPGYPGTMLMHHDSLKEWAIRGNSLCPATKINSAEGTGKEPNCAFVESEHMDTLRRDNGSKFVEVEMLKDVAVKTELLADYGDSFYMPGKVVVTTVSSGSEEEPSPEDSDVGSEEEEEPVPKTHKAGTRRPKQRTKKDKKEEKKKRKAEKAEKEKKASEKKQKKKEGAAGEKKSGKEEQQARGNKKPGKSANKKMSKKAKKKTAKESDASDDSDDEETDYSEHSESSNSGGSGEDMFARPPTRGSNFSIITLLLLITLMTLITLIALITLITPLCRHACQPPPARRGSP